MKNEDNKLSELLSKRYEVTEKGSLGLLAYGDIGLREWRKVKQEFYKKNSDDKK